MARNAEKQARSEAILGELAELGLALARDLAAQARACEDPEQQAALVEAFHKTSRTVRLTLALDAKLDRDAAREARDAEACASRTEAAPAMTTPMTHAPWRAEPTAAAARKGRVRSLMNRLLWDESEGDEAEHEVLSDDLEARLDEAARAPDFEAIPIEAVARRIAADMGLSSRLVLTLCEPSPPPASCEAPTPSPAPSPAAAAAAAPADTG